MAADSVIRVVPSTRRGTVPKGFIFKYDRAITRGGNGNIFNSYGKPNSSNIQSGRNERALMQW